MNITVFGASSPLVESPAYQFAYQLGESLANHGHTVLTGGYMGTMEAVSRGASQVGGHVIGVTCQEIENWRNTKCNPWVSEEWREKSLHERIIRLIDNCDAAIALPGGPGTLAEIVLMLNRMQIEVFHPKPLILVGSGWQKTFETFFDVQAPYITSKSRQLIHFAETLAEILSLVEEK